MKYYLIKESLMQCEKEEIHGSGHQFVAVLSKSEWEKEADYFNMGIDMDMDIEAPVETKAVVNTDSLTGTLVRPPLSARGDMDQGFSFALDETGIVLVDDSGYAQRLVDAVSRTKKWRLPGLERFIYDLLETSITGDLALLQGMEQELNRMEDAITGEELDRIPARMNTIRGDLLDLRMNYEQLIDLSQELEENENDFFRDETLRYFHMFTERVVRLLSMVNGQRDYAMQLRDLVQSNVDIKQNRIMALLTVITSIFLPLTLIAGWYGMNFRYMPELEWKWGYPVVIIVCILIVAVSLIYFRRKKWL